MKHTLAGAWKFKDFGFLKLFINAIISKKFYFTGIDYLQEVVKYLPDLKDKFSSIDRITLKFKEATEIQNSCSQLFSETCDKDLGNLINDEINNSRTIIEKLEIESWNLLKEIFLPVNHKLYLLEIAACEGGNEAALFAKTLINFYSRITEGSIFKPISTHKEEKEGGVKSSIFELDSRSFTILRFENGIHRVQRVSETDSKGRIHTSTVAVALLPILEKKFEFKEKDVKIYSYKASGPGGQHLHKTNSAVRIVHIPTGISVSNQDERSQIQNKEKALDTLKERLQNAKSASLSKIMNDIRMDQVKNSGRSYKARTYNYQRDVIIDHRIAETVHGIENFFSGDCFETINTNLMKWKIKEEISKLKDQK